MRKGWIRQRSSVFIEVCRYSLQRKIKNSNYSDIHWGIKLADANAGMADNVYTFPYFCAFLLKRYLRER
ncbi:hypothetical protein DWV97_08530 [Ruminococcus sp. AF14-10]|nr:hypothetical protein DWV97_08530 [Ruminococcus sp. AF14-10]